MITAKQTALLHVAKKELALEDDDYRAILLDAAGVDSSRDLDREGFQAVMRELEALGFKSSRAKPAPDYGHRYGFATPEQCSYIRSLWDEYTDGQGDDGTLGKWLQRTYKVSALRFVTYGQAPKAITALRAMIARKKAAAA